MHVLWEVVMTHKRIPKDWVIKRSTPFFTKENVPSALLTHHNTAAGVFGQLCVMEGTVTYYGFADENATEPEIKVVINAGAFATSPPQYWHRVELSDDAQFNINFWVAPDFSGEKVYTAKKE
ncbi:hypothetical protein MY012_26310 [Escherichia coli]|jgi:tellurite resistance-related uncharacterized protein|nr:hypothetical protein HMPREF9534_04545 [Escherichia coli MS 69-1]ESA69145.1 hypothetical protein HMPREF1588_03911 [Escherichia coli 110957]ESD79805.1 hypothetical protein HMPREF1611_04305 [Escherichia coli 908573]URC10134.1 cytoplasmic protein [Escherichia phage vB_EcoS-666R9]URC10293.1 cytoplasmic protein [Escherichia phage vB_EcoS-673R7]BEB67629.1 hypothetical protein VEE16_23960 [Escherichia coli]DAZ52934.1 MAG TPA: Tellurite resistance protein [Caudoviricetes sp.]